MKIRKDGLILRVSYQCNEGIFKMRFISEKQDSLSYSIVQDTHKIKRTISMGKNICEIHLPSDWTISSVHPDILAVATLAVIYPYSGPKITLPIGVSKNLHEVFLKLTNKEVLPIDDTLNPRVAPKDAVPVLSYSGGIDSTAASLLLPPETHLFYLDRITPKNSKIKSSLNQEAAYYACRQLELRGRKVHRIKSDIQFVRNPVGFSTFLTDAVPALLLADYYGFDSLGNGHTLEEAYQVGYAGYEDIRVSDLYTVWGKILEAIDMPYSLPVAGLSEVVTTKIVMNSSYREFAQACSRGKVHKPCLNCFKCFRKSLLEKIITNSELDDPYLNKLFAINDVKNVLKTQRIHFGNVLAFITANYHGSHIQMNVLKNQVGGNGLDVAWMEKWYSDAFELMVPKYRDDLKTQILQHAEEMNDEDIQNMKKY